MRALSSAPWILRAVLLLRGVALLVVLVGWPAADARAAELPRVSISTRGEIRDEPKVAGRIRIDGISSRIGIELRGHSSQELFAKKQYGLETRERDGSNRDIAPLGLPPGDDWVLSAPYTDKSLMRNALAYRTARRMGRYAPRTRFVELRINGNYRGVYVFTEKLKLGDDRLPQTPDGFLVELTFPFQASGEKHFTGPRSGRPILYHEPDRGRRLKRVRKVYGDFERALYSRGRKGAARNWRERVDIGAAVDFLLVQELFTNKDAFHGSTYIHRASDGRVALGPVWDFDLSMGNTDEPPGTRVTGFVSRGRPLGDQLLRDGRFRRALRARWWELRDAGLRRDLARDVRRMRGLLHNGPARRNFERWRILGRYVYGNRVDPRTGAYRTSWESEVDFLRGWVMRRIRWLDSALPRPRG